MLERRGNERHEHHHGKPRCNRSAATQLAAGFRAHNLNMPMMLVLLLRLSVGVLAFVLLLLLSLSNVMVVSIVIKK